MTGVALLQGVAGVVLYLGYAWLVGSLCSRYCLAGGAGYPARRSTDVMRRGEPWAACACLAGGAAWLYTAACTMSGLPLAHAHRVVWLTASQTSVGRNCLAGLAIMGLALVLVGAAGRARRRSTATPATPEATLLAILLAAYACSRALSSHAAEAGLLSIEFAMEWLHVMFTVVWVGIVLMSAWLIVPLHRAAGMAHRVERGVYLQRLSGLAGAALAGIVVTGVYNASMRIGSWSNATGNAYSNVLLIKGALVLLALAIGAYNKVFGFPLVTSTGRVAPHVLLLLRAESVLLIGALSTAVLLGSMSPPSSM
jgi:putative copper resistance protein D